ncbi:MAG: nucleoside deaminase [Anaerolineales bacterium]|nr:nucleoside deaminase [Anaerolineales bacterium]
MDEYLAAAIEQANMAMKTGGVPIGSVLVLDGVIVGQGYNRQNQLQSIIRHAEMDCIDNAGALKTKDYQRSVIYTTLSPCEMCAGAIIFFKIPKVVIGENINFQGAEQYLQSRGVEVEVLNDPNCIQMLQEFDEQNPGIWNKGE